MDGFTSPTTNREAICAPLYVRGESAKFDIPTWDWRNLSDDDGTIETTGWYKYRAWLVGISTAGRQGPVLDICVEVNLVRTMAGREDSHIESLPRVLRLTVGAWEANIEFDPCDEDGFMMARLPIPESWKTYASDCYDYAFDGGGDDIEPTVRPFRAKTINKTAEARRDFDNPPSGTITARSEPYPIRTVSEYTYREIVNGKTQTWPTFGRSTFVARATCTVGEHLEITFEETLELWVPGHDEVPVWYVNMKPRTEWIRTKGTSWDNTLRKYSRAWNGSVTVSGEIHSADEHPHGSPSKVTFWIPRTWMKWTHPFPPARDAQTIEARGYGPKLDPIDENERAETRTSDLETARLKRFLWRDHVDHENRRRHTGTAREKAREQNEIRRLRKNAEAWRDRIEGADVYREDPIARIEREEVRSQAEEDARNEETVWELFSRTLAWEESLMTSRDPLEEVYAEELYAKGDRPDSINKIRDNALLERHWDTKALKTVFVKALKPIPFAILNRPLSERYKLYVPIPILKEGLWKRLIKLAHLMEPNSPQTDDRLRQSRAFTWNDQLLPETLEREAGPVFQLIALTRALILVDSLLESIVRDGKQVKEWLIENAVRSHYLWCSDHYLH